MHINIILNNTHLIKSDQKIPDNIVSNQKIPKCLFLVQLLNRLSMMASSIGWRICQRPYILLFSGPHFKAYLFKIMLCYFYKILIYSCTQIVKLYKKLSTNVEKKKKTPDISWMVSLNRNPSQSIKIQLNWSTKLVKPNVPKY